MSGGSGAASTDVSSGDGAAGEWRRIYTGWRRCCRRSRSSLPAARVSRPSAGCREPARTPSRPGSSSWKRAGGGGGRPTRSCLPELTQALRTSTE